MVRRGGITDTAWAEVKPLPPDTAIRGQQWRDHRQVLNGVIWMLRPAPRSPTPLRQGHRCPTSVQ